MGTIIGTAHDALHTGHTRRLSSTRCLAKILFPVSACRSAGSIPGSSHWYKQGQQYKCPHCVTTGSRTASKQMLQPKRESCECCLVLPAALLPEGEWLRKHSHSSRPCGMLWQLPHRIPRDTGECFRVHLLQTEEQSRIARRFYFFLLRLCLLRILLETSSLLSGPTPLTAAPWMAIATSLLAPQVCSIIVSSESHPNYPRRRITIRGATRTRRA
jgi:hypothetical protein